MIKKILIFSTAYLPLIGGAEVAIKEITDRMGNEDFSARGGPAFIWDMITARIKRDLPKCERLGNINVYRIGLGLGALDKIILAMFGAFKARRLDKKNNYDAIWSIMASQASIGAAFFKIFNKNKKLILTLQEGDEEEHLARYVFNIKFLYKLLVRPWHRLVFKKADKVTAISNYLKERAIKNGVKAPVEIIPNGVDIRNYELRIMNHELNRLKNKLGIKKNDKILITTGRLVKKNAVDDIIRSLTCLDRNIKFISLGAGPDFDKLKNLAKETGVDKRVLFLPLVENKDVIKYLKIADIFIRPSLSEGLGNSFLEAMAAGIPVIGTPVGGIPDFLINNETGFFCEVQNPKSIAEKVNYILDEKNKEAVLKVKENACRLVAEKYNWDKIAEKMKNIFNIL